MSLPPDYFTRQYAGSPDPWGFRTRWYEQRKRDVTLACLPRPSYRSGFEPGCSIGVLSAALAGRCERLLVADVEGSALATCRSELAGLDHVEVDQMRVPGEWPVGEFDLIVVSELAYYLDSGALDLLLERAVGSLEDGGTLLACHWRRPVADHPLSGDVVQQRVLARAELAPLVSHVEPDFRLDVLSKGAAASPAQAEGLVP
jgi:SAM-dependent methyltransferase